jgi:hypothetical protein
MAKLERFADFESLKAVKDSVKKTTQPNSNAIAELKMLVDVLRRAVLPKRKR